MLTGDCVEVMRRMPDRSIDAVVTDPPYAMSILNREWDRMAPREFQTFTQAWATEALRVLKPGGYMAAFGSPKTFHRLASGIEDAGFMIRDSIAWLYTQGFPKSADVSAAMDAWQAGETWEPVGVDHDTYTVTAFLRQARDAAGWTNQRIDDMFGTNGMAGHWTSSASQPHVPRIEQWDRLKDALGFDDTEIRALVERLAATGIWTPGTKPDKRRMYESLHDSDDRPKGKSRLCQDLGSSGKYGTPMGEWTAAGQRWGTGLKPAFEPIILAMRPTAGSFAANIRAYGTGALHTESEGRFPANVCIEDGLTIDGLDYPGETFQAFRYTPKAPPSERPAVDGVTHPTVKPVKLMAWLVDLITPPGGRVLDPFAGSGSTGLAAIQEGRDVTLIERAPAYVKLINHRISQPIQLTLDW